MAVELPPELEREIEKLAEKAHVSTDECVRQSLTKLVERAAESPVDRMAKLNGPTCDIEAMIAEIETGRSECYPREDLP